MEEYLPIVRKFGDPIFTLTAEVYYYIAKAFQGDQKALDTAVNLINVCFNVGFKAFAVTMAPFISELFFQTGEYESALAWIKKILDHVDKTGSHMNDAELFRIKGLTLMALNKPDTFVEECFSQSLELSRTQKAKTKRRLKLPGLIKKPHCESCAQETMLPSPPLANPPPLIVYHRGRRRNIETAAHYCPYPHCPYYGWLGRGNIRANGHPGGGEWRQLYQLRTNSIH
jgi:hypothetical protein